MKRPWMILLVLSLSGFAWGCGDDDEETTTAEGETSAGGEDDSELQRPPGSSEPDEEDEGWDGDPDEPDETDSGSTGDEADSGTTDEAPEEIIALVNQRQQARRDKDFALADDIRDRLAAEGWVIEDTPDGARVKRI